MCAVAVGPEIEVLHADMPRGRFRSALFDFDGTLSLIREGWPQVMVPMMVEVLLQTGTGETEAELHRLVEAFVMRLTGRQTIYQMIHLAEEVRKRGGQPLDPVAYKHRYHELLMRRIQGRIADLEAGRARPAEWTVPGSHALLEGLRRRGVVLYLASGTDLHFVRHEARLGVLELVQLMKHRFDFQRGTASPFPKRTVQAWRVKGCLLRSRLGRQ